MASEHQKSLLATFTETESKTTIRLN